MITKNHVPSPGPPTLASIAPVKAIVPEERGVKIVLIDFRSGEAVNRHPDLAGYLSQGATIRSAEPRITEAGALKLLVVLTFPESLL